jgi:hypothetical protein
LTVDSFLLKDQRYQDVGSSLAPRTNFRLDSLFSFCSNGSSNNSEGETMTELASVRAEIDRARKLVDRQRRDILALRRADIATADAELVLSRQLARLDGLIGERNRLMAAQPSRMQGRVLGGRNW